MLQEQLEKLTVALGLERRVVGVHFLFVEREYEDSKAKQLTGEMPYCRMAAHAMNGEFIKATIDNFTCQGGVEMLGFRPSLNYEDSGKQYDTFRLYSDMATSRQIHENMFPITQAIYGIEIGPLDKMEKADVVMMLCNGWQAMRMMQGYVFNYGTPCNLASIGNQAMCSDLTSRPYMTNELNISLLCAGARSSTNASDGEIGVGMPIQKFRMTLEGVLKTINSACGDPQKRSIEFRAKEAGVDLGFEIEYGAMYANYPEEYPEVSES